MRTRHWYLTIPVALATAIAPVAACGADEPPPVDVQVAGDADAGRAAIGDLGCSSCHTIPGVRGADAHVGPPLTDWAQRSYIAGALENTPGNLQRWILDPQEIEPGTAMPDVGATEDQARDVVAYLFGLGD